MVGERRQRRFSMTAPWRGGSAVQETPEAVNNHACPWLACFLKIQSAHFRCNGGAEFRIEGLRLEPNNFAKQTPPSSHFLISPALGAGFVVLGYRLVMTTV
jgi:hypothetical protein